jgi:acetyl esterase/lipase
MTLRRPLAAVTLALSLAAPARGEDRPLVPLWPGVAPGSEGKSAPEKVRIAGGGDHVVSSVHRPTLTVYLPDGKKAPGAGVLVMPGGGHRELWMDHEGHNVAQWLAGRGIAAFVLKYRLAREEGSTYQVPVESLQDAARALRLVKSRGAEWSVDPLQVGVLGFSAGGELAALLAARNDAGQGDSPDPVERQGSRPAFQALVYPGNSRAIAPAKDAPPAFLVCGADDRPDISEGLPAVYLLFKQAQVPVELHIYAGTGHGFGLRATNQSPSAGWPDRFLEWLGAQLGPSRGRLSAPPQS